MAPGYFLLFIIHPLKLCIMTTTNRLFYDDCKNNICNWSITADIYEQRKNGFYHITNSSKETAINYFRITEPEYNLLYQSEDKQYFKYLLYTLCIVERWKRESNEALKKLEELTGQTCENPYKPENERFTLKLTDEERTTITNRINDGYYRPEAVQARKDEEKRVMLSVLYAGLSVM